MNRWNEDSGQWHRPVEKAPVASPEASGPIGSTYEDAGWVVGTIPVADAASPEASGPNRSTYRYVMKKGTKRASRAIEQRSK
jgi:hypothetical protein